MPATVYLETSVLSYLTARPTNDIIAAAHQIVTTRWWSERRSDFELFISELVLSEVAGGDATAARRRLELVSDIPMLRVTDAAEALAATFLTSLRLPPRAAADALHVAIATVHGMDYLLTWNVRHIANAETRRRVETICRDSGHVPPVLCTPEELPGVREVIG